MQIEGVVRALAGDLTFTDPVTGTKTLAQLAAAGAGSLGGTLGTVDNAIPRADGTGGLTAQGSPVVLDDTGLISAGLVGARLAPQASHPGGSDDDTFWWSTGGDLYIGNARIALAYEITETTFISPTALAAQANDYTPTGWDTATHVRQAITGSQTITGFGTSALVKNKFIFNISTVDTLTLAHDSGSSLSDNRIRCPYGVDLAIPPGGGVIVCEEPAPGPIWRVVAVGSIMPTTLGAALQELRVNAGGTAVEWFTPTLDDYVPGTAAALQVPRRNAGNTAFEWATIAIGAGDVVGPAGATDNAFARFDATTGKLLQDSVVTCSDLGAITGITTLGMSGNLTLSAGNVILSGVGATVDGRDISADGTTLDSHVASVIKHLPASLGTAAQQLRVNAGATAPEWFTPSGAGEANTTSNSGATGTGIALTKSGVDLPFAKINGLNGISEALVSNVLEIDGVLLLPRDGTRAMTAALDMATFGLVSLGYATISPTAIAAQQNDYSPTSWSGADIVRLTFTGSQTITGFSATATAVAKIIQNIDTTDSMTIAHESASSSAANRVTCPNAVSLVIPPGGSVRIVYDATSTRWRPTVVNNGAIAAPGAILHAVRRSAQITNVTSYTFPGFDTTLQALNSTYWSYSSGSWTCNKAHTSVIHTKCSYKVNTGASVLADLSVDIVQGSGGSYTNNLQTHTDSCYSTTDISGHLTSWAIRAWAVNEQFRVYYYTNSGAADLRAAQNECYIQWISDT